MGKKRDKNTPGGEASAQEEANRNWAKKQEQSGRFLVFEEHAELRSTKGRLVLPYNNAFFMENVKNFLKNFGKEQGEGPSGKRD